jgi:hypothetical protein
VASSAWRTQYGADWEAAFRSKFETDMIDKLDTHFSPEQMDHCRLFYPSKVKPDLFSGMN